MDCCQCITSMARYRCRYAICGTDTGCEKELINNHNQITMSKFSDISKAIGLQGSAKWPTMETALELQTKTLAGDINAFTEVFRIHRFAESPVTWEDERVSNIIWNAFAEGSKLIKDEA